MYDILIQGSGISALSFIEGLKVENKTFKNIEDLILAKNSMRQPPVSNVPFRIEKIDQNIIISKKIIKADGPALSDPSIGQILNICFALRKLNFTGNITITRHGLNQKNFDNMNDNKLLLGCKMLNIGLENINIQKDGRITGTCGNFVYGEQHHYNLYDPKFTEIFNPQLVPSLCTKTGCWCQPEMLMTKWKL